MSFSLGDYSDMVNKQIALVQHDVEPQYLPNLMEIRRGSMFCLDVLHVHLNDLLRQGGVMSYPGLDRVFKESFSHLISNIKTHQQWSFWHYTLICAITSLPYAEMISKGEHKTIDLGDQKNWDNPDFKVPVLYFNYVAGKLYPDALPKLIETQKFKQIFTRNESTTQRYKFFCSYLLNQIKLVSNEKAEF